MKITNSTRHRMKELGLTTLRQWMFHKFMFNNVSFTQEDVNSQSGEKVYAKFARAFTKFEEDNSIWKDPKIELPSIGRYRYVAVITVSNTLCLGYIKIDDDELCLSQFNGGWLGFNDEILKWAYAEDLIKQANNGNSQ